MRAACAALLLGILAGVAYAAPADRYAARALLTSRVVAEFADKSERMRMARPLLEALGSEAKGPTGDTRAIGNLLLEMRRLLNLLGPPPQADEVYINACKVCGRIAPKGPAKGEWTVRWLRNAVQSIDPKSAAGWVDGFRVVTGAELSEDATRQLGEAARLALQRKWWSSPATDVADSNARVALMEAVLAAHEPAAKMSQLAAHFRAAAEKIVKLAASDQPRAALGLWDLTRLCAASGRRIEGLPQLRVSLDQRTYDPPSYAWPRKVPNRRTKIRFDKTVRSAHVYSGDKALELPPGTVYIVPGLPYMLELGLKGGKAVPCYASWPKGTDGVLSLHEIPDGYAVVFGAEGGGRTWYARRSAWDTLQLIEALIEWSREPRKDAEFASVEAFFHAFTKNHDLKEPDVEFLRTGYAKHGAAKITPKTLAAFREAIKTVEGLRLPTVGLVDGLPAWARKKIGWEGEVVRDGGVQGVVAEFLMFDVIEVK
ncbi:MAG: hypothetical protein ACYTGN_13725 [Planctomycetota bacterium]|jgi:hypothetical protein